MKHFWVHEIGTAGSRIKIGPEESRHMVRVLRYRAGQIISLFDSAGNLGRAEILSCRPDGVEVALLERIEKVPEKSRTVLCQALLKGKKMDPVLQKCTELGVNRIIPFRSARCVPVWDEAKADQKVRHWQQIITSAVKQSGARSVPEVASVCRFQDLVAQAPEGFLKLIFWEKERGMGLKKVISSTAQLDRVFCVVGPEGGFDDSEVDLARKSGFVAVGLGQRILRSETVPVAIMSILGFERGDFE